MFSSFHSSPWAPNLGFLGLETYPEEKVKDTRLAPARHTQARVGACRDQETHLKSSVVCVSGSCSCASSTGEGRGEPRWISLVALSGVTSPLPPSSASPHQDQIELKLRCLCLHESLKIQVLIRLLHHRYNCRFFFKKKSLLKETDVWAD